jgi:quinoprotein glucose dehydrogenase
MSRLFGPDVTAKAPDWGSVNLGGPIVTAGGLVFIGAALDGRLHAYDVETGRELWHGELPASAKATPMSYRLASGDQFVAVAVGGGEPWGVGDHIVAFRLRR